MLMFCITLQRIKKVPILSQNGINSYSKHGSARYPPCLLLKNTPFPVFLCSVMESDDSQVTSPGGYLFTKSPPWLFKSYCLSDMQMYYQPWKMELSFYQPAAYESLSASWYILLAGRPVPHGMFETTNNIFYFFYQNCWNIVGMFRKKCRMISFG